MGKTFTISFKYMQDTFLSSGFRAMVRFTLTLKCSTFLSESFSLRAQIDNRTGVVSIALAESG